MGEFGDRMKLYEGIESDRRFMPTLPVCARLDGRSFSKYTKQFERPYDKRMSDLMCQTTEYLVSETKANMGYTQSDEMSLVWYSDDIKSQIFFDGRIQKMVSILASMATAYFNAHVRELLPEKEGTYAHFDCRVWQVPSLMEATNTFLWREQDASKNSISMAARHYFSHNQLHGKNADEMQELLFQKGVNWNDYPAFFKRGTFIQKRKVERAFTANELEQLPPKHEAHTNPHLVVERTEVRRLDMPRFGSVDNRVLVVFEGADPIEKQIKGN